MPKLYSIPVFFVAAFAAFGQEASDKLPDGKGKAEVKKICTACHEIESVIGSRRTKIGWERNVEDMVTRGAEGSDDELQLVIDYLTRFYGKINVNTASENELQSALGLSAKETAAIVDWRKQNGNIKTFEELAKVPGLSVEKLQAKRPLIAFSL